jgi:hypothetical protein
VIIAEETEPQEERGRRPQMLQAQPSEERNGEAPFGYSGRTALRREQCNVDDKTLLGDGSVKQQWERSDRFYAMTQYTRVYNGGEYVFCVVGAWLHHEYEAISQQQSHHREVGPFSTSQYEDRREMNAVNQ